MDCVMLFLEEKQFTTEKIMRDYERLLTRVLLSLGGFDRLKSLTPPELHTYLKSDDFLTYKQQVNGEFVTCRYAPKTVEKHLDILRSFLNYLYANGLLDYDLGNTIEKTEQSRGIRITNLPSAKDISELMGYFLERPYMADASALRDLIIFQLVLFCGASAEEVVSLNQDDLALSEGHYYVHSNTRAPRDIPINQQTAALISRHIEIQDGPIAGMPLFVGNKTGSRLGVRTVSYFLHKACDRLKIKKHSAEQLKNAGVIAALSIKYPIPKMAIDLGVNPDYFARRIKESAAGIDQLHYADLFKK